jgi:hypothetical protein
MSIDVEVPRPPRLPSGFIPVLAIIFACGFVTIQAAAAFARLRKQQDELESVLQALKNRQRWDSRNGFERTPPEFTPSFTTPPNGANPVRDDGAKID